MSSIKLNRRGFTIVELLIVIVVIAILAAISIVAYNGIQQRAKNTAIIDAASKTYKILQAYIAETGQYPITTGSACITTGSGCSTTVAVAANTAFETNIAKIGVTPKSIPDSGTTYNGIYINYASTTWNGDPQPLRMNYSLEGTSQQCGIGRVSNYAYPGYQTSTTGYTWANIDNNTGKTLCWISVQGPAA